ncbi:MAG: hypothetical protein GY854_13570 [Deltaproteobacteria bacterium]|nr:hypothetical protein [Deltaproteobacteria bacterium]
MRRWSKGLALLAIIVATAFIMSCAEERDPINRVQPNVIKKAMLDGEWYFHQRIMDVPGGMLAGMFYPAIVGWYSDPERIRFEIQENFLYVRRVRELVEDSVTYNRDYDENFSSYVVLAAFRILSHFDIQRDYNPVTGESMNVVSENMYDRPWYEREYIRIDWSQNLSPGFSGMTWMMDLAPSDPTPFFVQTECTPDLEFSPNLDERCIPEDKAPFFDIVWNEDGTSLERGYFDITTQSTIRPGMMYLEGYGELPTCMLIGHDADECSSAQYFLRNSFWKYIPEEHDFEAMEYSGNISSQFGFFYSSILNYETQEVVKETGREYLINRYNLWEQSHKFSKDDDADGDCTNEGCLCKTDTDCCVNYGNYFQESLERFVNERDQATKEVIVWNNGYEKDTAEHAAHQMAMSMCKSTCDVNMDLRPDDRVAYEEENSCQFHVTESDLVPECEKVHYCTLPYDERRVRPIVYYTNKEWPEELNHRPDDPGVSDDEESREAWKYAYVDQQGETRPVNEQVSDGWNAVFTRVINILKNKAAGKEVDPNVPYVDDDMKRTEPGKNAKFEAIGVVPKDGNGVLQGKLGFNENWYDDQRPPFIVCRFSPVLGPNGDVDPDGNPDDREPDICWERIQEMSHCVFDPANPGINPKTGEIWTEASEWPICSARESAPRYGDIRYSMAFWVDKWYEGFGLLGLGPGYPDLLTGETISGTANLYALNNNAARRVVDMTMLITGDLDTKEYIDGYNLAGWRNRYTGTGTNPSDMGYSLGQIGSMGAAAAHNVSQGGRFNLNLAGNSSAAEGNGLPSRNPSVSTDASASMKLHTLDEMLQAASTSVASSPIHDDDAMIKSIASSPGGASIEANLLNTDNSMTMLAANGLNPNTDINDESVKNRMLITRNNPFKLADARKRFEELLTVKMKADFVDTTAEEASVSLAHEVQSLRRQGLLPTENTEEFRNGLWRLARKKMMHAVTLHEIGHSIGLRHNFGGSQDFLNYKKEYWDIRRNGCADVKYDHLAPDVTDWQSEPGWDEESGCGNTDPQIGPRFVKYAEGKPWSGDPLSQYEVYKKIYHKAVVSIMDYAGTYHIDEDGLGRYDWAVILFGYGHHFEIFKDYPKDKQWKVHDSLVPGIATADSPDAFTIIDEDNYFFDDFPTDEYDADLKVGTLVVNLKTGEQSTVASIEPSNSTLGGTLTLTTPFSAPLEKGDKFAVWGPPLMYKGQAMEPLNNTFGQYSNFTVEEFLKHYNMFSGQIDLSFGFFFVSPHYTTWAENWGTPEAPSYGFNDQSARDVMDIRNFDWRVISQGGDMYVPGFNQTDQPYSSSIRVPYVYCTDNSANITSKCRTRDYGADDWERAHNIIADWDMWYISRSFIRHRIGFWPNDYPGAYYDRLYRVPKRFNDYFALISELLWSSYEERVAMAMFIDPWNSWAGYTTSVHDMFNMLMQTLSAPDVGRFTQFGSEYRLQDGAWAVVNSPYTKSLGGFEMGNVAFDISQGARVFETQYSNGDNDASCGNDFYRCLWNAGWYYDKVMAINGLTESSTFFVARDTAIDVRQFRISFFDNFNWQIKKYFAAMMGEDWAAWAPVTVTEQNAIGGQTSAKYPLMDENMILPLVGEESWMPGLKQPKLFFRDWANPAGDITQPAVYHEVLKNMPRETDEVEARSGEETIGLLDDGSAVWTPIDPNFGFTTQVYAMVLGMSRFQHNYDISFYNTGRMWTRAGDEPVGEADIDEDPLPPIYPDIDAGTDAGEEADAGDEVDAGDLESNPSLEETVNIVSYYDPENAMVYKAIETYAPNNVLHAFETQETKAIGVAAAMINLANKLRSRGNDCDPIAGPDAHYTKTAADDCCDDPYGEDYPLTPNLRDDCPAEYGDPTVLKPWEFASVRNYIEIRRKKADEYLKRYRGILDFQVRLTNVFDYYMGFVGNEYDPGVTPAE